MICLSEVRYNVSIVDSVYYNKFCIVDMQHYDLTISIILVRTFIIP